MILSVMIPTYNRKEKLIRTLSALSTQTFKDFGIIISDNNSNYSIENEILHKYEVDFRKSIKVHHNRVNVGLSLNMAGLFTLCPTEWAWFLGDDDIIFDDSVEKIVNIINNNAGLSGSLV